MFIFTQFQTTCCLRCPQSESKDPALSSGDPCSLLTFQIRDLIVLWTRELVIVKKKSAVSYSMTDRIKVL